MREAAAGGPAPPSLSVVVPLYNEADLVVESARGIRRGLEAAGRSDFELILVPNGCTDETPSLVESIAREDRRVRTIVLPSPDVGRAQREGLLAAGAPRVAQFDCDYWDLEFLRRALDAIGAGADVVLASKTLPGSHDRRPWFRRAITRARVALVRGLLGLRASDASGMKVWRNDERLRALVAATISNGQTFDTELVIRSERAGRRVVEVPVEVVEKRPPRRSVAVRSIEALREVLRVRRALRRE